MDERLVLVCDDDADNRDLMRMLVADMVGARPLLASDGVEGLALARQVKPSLVLLDLRLPRLDGLAVTRELKADPATRTIPVVAVTASIHGAEVAIAAGCADCIRKPFDVDDFVARVRRQLAD